MKKITQLKRVQQIHKASLQIIEKRLGNVLGTTQGLPKRLLELNDELDLSNRLKRLTAIVQRRRVFLWLTGRLKVL